jgi:hypothetical protein
MITTTIYLWCFFLNIDTALSDNVITYKDEILKLKMTSYAVETILQRKYGQITVTRWWGSLVACSCKRLSIIVRYSN